MDGALITSFRYPCGLEPFLSLRTACGIRFSLLTYRSIYSQLRNEDAPGVVTHRANWEASDMRFANRMVPILVLGSLSGLLLLHAGCGGYTGSAGNTGGRGATVPAAPSGLTVASGNAQIMLNWAASSGAAGYYVKRSTTTGGPYTQTSTQSGLSWTDTGVTNGTKYFYVVSAYNSAGQSANSAEVSATPELPAPTAPTGLSATAGNAQVSLSWNASSGATSYHVKRSTTSGGETQISAPSSNSFTDTGLTNGTKYFYVVSAVNSEIGRAHV